ncbi:hypothetical protein V8F20_001599 [Naviculisporaceae sp. PSN 640]
MPRHRIPWLAVSLATLSSTSWAIPANELFGRQSSSCPANFSQCSAGSLPDNFCCPSGNTCVPLAANTTLLCCPTGRNCTVIQPIKCTIGLQDADRFPEAVIKTTALRGKLDSCGNNTCCPFGYTCNGENQCVKNINQNVAPVEAPEPSTPPSSTPSSPGPSPTDTSPTEPGIGEAPAQGNSRSGPPVAVIAGASVAAVVVVVGAAVIAFLLARQRKKEEKNAEMVDTLKLTRSTSSFGNFISNPIVAEDSTIRTDFSRLPSSARSKPFGDGESTIVQSPPQSISSFPTPPTAAAAAKQQTRKARQSSIAYGYGAPATSPYIYGQNLHVEDSPTVPQQPQTPRRAPQDREPSSVSINVFADPRTLTPESLAGTGDNRPRDYISQYNPNRMTSFTQMMEEAELGGVARGQPYVPYRPDSQQGSPSRTKRY